jgi:hypothetical protein
MGLILSAMECGYETMPNEWSKKCPKLYSNAMFIVKPARETLRVTLIGGYEWMSGRLEK